MSLEILSNILEANLSKETTLFNKVGIWLWQYLNDSAFEIGFTGFSDNFKEIFLKYCTNFHNVLHNLS
jgi:hypothetical protein